MASGEITEVFACGTAAVVTPVGRAGLGGRRGDGHRRRRHQDSVTVRLRATLLDIQYGRAEDPHGWMTRLV